MAGSHISANASWAFITHRPLCQGQISDWRPQVKPLASGCLPYMPDRQLVKLTR